MEPIRPVSRRDPTSANAPVESVSRVILTPIEREEARQRREQARKRMVRERRDGGAQDQAGRADHLA
jgi:hypothetical protein